LIFFLQTPGVFKLAFIIAPQALIHFADAALGLANAKSARQRTINSTPFTGKDSSLLGPDGTDLSTALDTGVMRMLSRVVGLRLLALARVKKPRVLPRKCDRRLSAACLGHFATTPALARATEPQSHPA
jgi:hypothetical protein